jgi:hypothetical protein
MLSSSFDGSDVDIQLNISFSEIELGMYIFVIMELGICEME